jgi:hypothetical protein
MKNWFSQPSKHGMGKKYPNIRTQQEQLDIK